MSATETTPTTTTPSGVEGPIPDGHTWTSKNGIQCYKVPKKDFDNVVGLLPNIQVAGLTDTQLANAAAMCTRLFAERKPGVFLVFPVRYEKQAAANTMYFDRLRKFQQAVQAEQAHRSEAALFGE